MVWVRIGGIGVTQREQLIGSDIQFGAQVVDSAHLLFNQFGLAGVVATRSGGPAVFADVHGDGTRDAGSAQGLFTEVGKDFRDLDGHFTHERRGYVRVEIETDIVEATEE